MLATETISVIIPTYNSAEYISDAIESVLNQSFKPFEIIVVDDGSSDNTQTRVENYDGNIRYVRQEKSGVSAARNRGLELAKGDLIAFIDADDIWIQKKLQLQLQLLQENPEYEMVVGFLKRTRLAGNESQAELDGEKGIFVLHLGSTLIRRSLFEEVGFFAEEMTLSEDIDWFFRVLEKDIKVLIHREVVQYYRQHDQNLTKDKKRTNLYLLKAIKKSLDRRRVLETNYSKPLPKLDNMEEIMEYWLSG